MATVTTVSIADALAEIFPDTPIPAKFTRTKRRVFRSFEDELNDILSRYQHCITYIEEDAVFAAERHGLSEEYAMARLYAHPACEYPDPETL